MVRSRNVLLVDANVVIDYLAAVMTELVRRRQLEAEEAVRAARAIHRSNPFHIPESLVDRFSDRVRSLERGRRGG